MRSQANTTAILCLVAGIAIFSVQDLILKLLSGDYPLHEAMVLRSLTAIPFMLAITRWFDGSLRTILSAELARHAGAGAFELCGLYRLLPCPGRPADGDDRGALLHRPAVHHPLSVAVLHERVSSSRWLAILVGFGGVILMVRPGGGLFDWAALLPVFCGFAYALSMVMARRMGTQNSAAAMAFWGNNAFLLCSLGLAAVFGAGGHAGDMHPSLAFMARGWVMPSLDRRRC